MSYDHLWPHGKQWIPVVTVTAILFLARGATAQAFGEAAVYGMIVALLIAVYRHYTGAGEQPEH